MHEKNSYEFFYFDNSEINIFEIRDELQSYHVALGPPPLILTKLGFKCSSLSYNILMC